MIIRVDTLHDAQFTPEVDDKYDHSQRFLDVGEREISSKSGDFLYQWFRVIDELATA